MAERTHLDWFRGRLAASHAIEPKDPAPILAWREAQRKALGIEKTVELPDLSEEKIKELKRNIK